MSFKRSHVNHSVMSGGSSPRNSEVQRLKYPIAGDSGYNEPVGRKHFSPKHTVMQKIIFGDIDQTLQQSYLSASIRRKPSLQAKVTQSNSQYLIKAQQMQNRKQYNYLIQNLNRLNPRFLIEEGYKKQINPHYNDFERRDSLSQMIDSRVISPESPILPRKQYQPNQNEKLRSKSPTFLNSLL